MLQHLFNHWFVSLDIQKMSAASVMVEVSIMIPVLLWTRRRKKDDKRILVMRSSFAVPFLYGFPLLLMAGSALMSEGEMLERFGAVFDMGNAPIKQQLFIPTYPTLKPLCGAAFWILRDFFLCYVLEFLSADRAGAGWAAAYSLPGAWAFAHFCFSRKEGIVSFLHHSHDAALSGDHGPELSGP